jgi:hypothetical protein
MIIPNLTIPSSNPGEGWVDAVTEQILYWSLYGQTCLSIVGQPSSDLIADLETVIKRVGGAVDLLIRSDAIAEDDALKLLNVGGSKIAAQMIPDDRMIVLQPQASDKLAAGDYVLIDQDPDVDEVAELEEMRVDTIIDAVWLESKPDFAGEFFAAVLKSDRPDGLWPTVITDPLLECREPDARAEVTAGNLLVSFSQRALDQGCDQRSDASVAGYPNGLRSRLFAIYGDSRCPRLLPSRHAHLLR